MRVIPVDKVKPGMVVERTIHGSKGEILLNKGVQIDARYIQRLKDIGVPAIYVWDENIGKVEYDEVVSNQTRLEALSVARDVVTNLRLRSDFDIRRVNKVVDDLVSELVTSRDLLVALIDMRAANDEGFYHSVNTTVLSVITGLGMGYNDKQLRQLACGALFHDIGVILLPPELLKKPTPLSPEENKQILKHPELGFQILRKKEGVSLMSAHVALQHHEKFDGSGYPRGLAGDEICEYARIVAIAAIYDNFVGLGSNKQLVLPHQAIQYLIKYGGIWFDPEILKVFVGIIAVFPIGSVVQLNSGVQALVTRANKNYPSRPVVRVFKNRVGARVAPPFEIDLEANPEYFIQTIVVEEP